MRKNVQTLVAAGLLALTFQPAEAGGRDQDVIDSLVTKLNALVAPPKEITQGCVRAPLPTQVQQPSFRGVVDDSGFGTTTRFVFDAWRVRCTDDDYQLLVTLIPFYGTSAMTGAGFSVQQGGRNWLVTMVEDDAFKPFAPPLTRTTTVMLRAAGEGPAFDDDADLSLTWNGLGSDTRVFLPSIEGTVPVYRINDESAGVFFDPAMSGHGMNLGVVAGTNRMVGNWYTTALDGSDALDWFVLSGTFSGPRAELDILRVKGHVWGTAFEGSPEIVGSLSLVYRSCSEIEVTTQLAEGARVREARQTLRRVVPTPACR